jgi:hypothetical protein
MAGMPGSANLEWPSDLLEALPWPAHRFMMAVDRVILIQKRPVSDSIIAYTAKFRNHLSWGRFILGMFLK